MVSIYYNENVSFTGRPDYLSESKNYIKRDPIEIIPSSIQTKRPE